MNKKYMIAIATTLFILITMYFGYKYYTFYFPPHGTGAAPSKISEVEIQEGIFINNLIKSLPKEFDSFTIESYDYSRGKFKVVMDDNSNETPDQFINWLLESEYKSIPEKMFDIQISN